jgi:hypothetical protein
LIDLAGAAAHRIGPVAETPLADSAENSVEIRFADEERVVLRPDRALGVGEVERDPLSSSTTSKWPKRVGAERPSISARKRADFVWSDDQTIVWLS